jgi:hypothetical protein
MITSVRKHTRSLCGKGGQAQSPRAEILARAGAGSAAVSCPGSNWTFAAADFGGVQGARRKHIAGSICDRRATPHVGKSRVRPEG